eukprot:COSAG04_NODE_3186_length_3075_cov_2.017809_1_plen_77_part_00
MRTKPPKVKLPRFVGPQGEPSGEQFSPSEEQVDGALSQMINQMVENVPEVEMRGTRVLPGRAPHRALQRTLTLHII